eukprot:8904973-Alexandrium_andersonii.AAC.1
MSASLVGSEMCIRDSFQPCVWTQRALHEVQTLLEEARRQQQPPAACAVSYTHLTLPTICSV